MKRCTQRDLQRLYEAPPQELADRIQETIFSLPVREQEEKIVKKKLSLSAVIAVVLLIVLMATALAGATNEAFNAYLYRLWPEAAMTLMPVDLSCEDKGIRMEVNSASVHDSKILISYTLQDLEGDRLLPYSYEFYPRVYFGSKPVLLSNTGTEQYDEAEHKVYYAEYAEYDASKKNHSDSKYLILKVDLYGNSEMHGAELYPYLKEYGSQVQMCPVPDETLVQPYSGSGDYKVFSESGLPESLQVIDSSTSLEIPLFESVYLSGIKVIDGMMHIQLHIPGNDYIPYDNGSYAPYRCDTDLYNEDGLLPFVDDSLYENQHVLSWGRKINRTGYLPEWIEFIFPVNAETVDKVCSVPFRIEKVLPPIDASLSVKIPVRLISGKE